ncbi:hypothetical protein H4582DRAFT_2060031 [Lactarius indigo]|nr:hypothetical protein H4582DRAFT_2060031 [Lactarius indigo]
MLALSLLPLLLTIPGFAIPSRRSQVPASALTLPPNQQQLIAPATDPTFVGIIAGFQNFTCTEQGTYTSEGFQGQVFDTSVLFPGTEFSQIQKDVYTDWVNYPSRDAYDSIFAQQVEDKYGIPLSGQHYFVELSGEGGPVTHQVFDFRNNGPTKGNPDAIVVADATGDIPAPTGIPDVDWQQMTAVTGKFASTIFRVNTKSGQRTDPNLCQLGAPNDLIKFTAQLWFYGGQIAFLRSS